MKYRFHENVRFCPKCGVASIRRDFSHQSEPRPGGGGDPERRQVNGGTEWICEVCGFSFRITKSVLYKIAEDLFARERKLRNGVQFSTASVGEEVARKWSLEQSKDL